MHYKITDYVIKSEITRLNSLETGMLTRRHSEKRKSRVFNVDGMVSKQGIVSACVKTLASFIRNKQNHFMTKANSVTYCEMLCYN